LNLRRLFAFVWALVVCLLLAHNAYLWLGKRVAPDTDILNLLPVQERDPLLQQSFTHMVDAAQQRVIVLVGAKDWNAAKQAADAYTHALDAHHDLIQATPIGDAAQADFLAQFQSHSLLLLTADDAAKLRMQPAQTWAEGALRNMLNPFAGPKLGAWRDDPFGLFGDWVRERAQETPVRPRDGYLYVASADKQYVLLPLTLQQPAFSISAQKAMLPLLNQAEAAAHKVASDIDIVKTGVVLHAAAASAQADSEVSTIGFGSLIGIILLMWATFRSVKPIALILLSIGIGCLGAFSVCWLLFGRVHLLTLVFGASLIGVAQDYGIYYLCNRLGAEQELDSGILLKRLMPGLLLTLLTTVIGYMGLALTPFPGLRQMALFSAFGLIFAWFTVVCWFPSLLRRSNLRSGVLVRIYGAIILRWPLLRANKMGMISVALFALFAVIGCMRLGANDDIRLLQNPPAQLVNDQIKLGKLLDTPNPVQFFLVRGNSSEAVLQREEQLKTRLDPLVIAHKINGYQALSNWVPSMQEQAARKALIEQKLLSDDGPLKQLAAQVGEEGDWVAATRQHLLEAAQPVKLEDYLASTSSEPNRHLWLGSVNGEYGSIVALRGAAPSVFPSLQQAANGLDGVQWVDKVGEISSVLGRYRLYMGWVVLCSYIAVFAMLFPRYRFRTWRVLTPAAIASIATLALLGFVGQPLQLFHVLALMLLLGVGVDYGIFMLEHPQRGNVTPWLAVGLSAANTILSFGLLGLSKTPALQAFGMTMLIGTALVWLLVPCFGSGE